MIGWQLPEVSLMFPALALVNALLFHIGPTLVQRHFSPGTITAVFLFLPVGIWSYYGAYLDGSLTIQIGVVSALGGAVLMAYPIVLLRLKGRLRNYNK
jgi:tryptophan-rich sensory protein